MPELERKHNECENFAPVDVAKGICRLTNEIVLIDSAVCAEYEAIARCGGCAFFANAAPDGIGTCKGLQKEYWTSNNYRAELCEGYQRG